MPDIKTDQKALSAELGAARPVRLPATRYRQGRRDMFHITVAVAQLPQVIVKRPDPQHPIEGNRKVDLGRARKFGAYLLKNDDWISPAIIARAPRGELAFREAWSFEDGTAWGE